MAGLSDERDGLEIVRMCVFLRSAHSNAVRFTEQSIASDLFPLLAPCATLGEGVNCRARVLSPKVRCAEMTTLDWQKKDASRGPARAPGQGQTELLHAV